MGLLRQFEGMQLPAASELDWLVPEHDAPQKAHHLLIYYYLAKSSNDSCSWILNLVRSQELLLSALFSCSCCPSPTPCRSHPTTGNTQTSTSWGFECEETWNGRRRDHKSSSTFTLLPSESRAGSMFNLYPISMVTGAFIMFAAMLACFLWCMLTCLSPKSTAELFKCFREFYCLLPIRRKIVVAKQNYRCAGCGTRIDPGTINKGFRIYPLFEYSSWVKQKPIAGVVLPEQT